MAITAISLAPKIRKALVSYRRELIRAGIPLQALIVFGSQSKGLTHLESDIDVAVVSPIFGKDYHQEMVDLLNLRDGNSIIEPHPLNPEDLATTTDPLIEEIKTSGIYFD